MLHRLLIAVSIALGLSLAASQPAHANDPVVYAVHGAAIDGYDVVAYFQSGAPVRGDAKFRIKWRGAIWYFSSAKNLERFESNPKAFAPSYGGYCAYAMASGLISSVDPQVWRIVDGRLYLLHSSSSARMWQADLPAHIERAASYWSKAMKR